MIARTKYHIFLVVLTIFMIVFIQSCTHDPFVLEDPDPDPSDTMDNPIDTMVVDTMTNDTMDMGTPCDPDVVYFQNDILPILLGNCAFSGCHDAASASDGVVLDSYEKIISTADVKPFDLNDSELYEVITEDDEDKQMPPTQKLDNATINIIAQWILQGAENNACDDNSDCITTDMSFSTDILPIFDTSCNGCHSTSQAFGGIILDTYQEVVLQVENGKLVGAIDWDQGYKPMPQGQDKLDDCKISKIKSWIDDGAEDN